MSDECADEPQTVAVPWVRLFTKGQWLMLSFGFFGLILIPAWFIAGLPSLLDSIELTKHMGKMREITIAMHTYAEEHGGKFPDGATSNDAFRELFKAGILEREYSFNSKYSPYVADNKIGTAPDFAKALEPGENHWAMTRGLTPNSPGDTPLIFENPAVVAWPPLWNVDARGTKTAGRAWRKGRISIARIDGSAGPEWLESSQGTAVPLKRGVDGKNLFEHAGPHEILDVAR